MEDIDRLFTYQVCVLNEFREDDVASNFPKVKKSYERILLAILEEVKRYQADLLRSGKEQTGCEDAPTEKPQHLSVGGNAKGEVNPSDEAHTKGASRAVRKRKRNADGEEEENKESPSADEKDNTSEKKEDDSKEGNGNARKDTSTSDAEKGKKKPKDASYLRRDSPPPLAVTVKAADRTPPAGTEKEFIKVDEDFKFLTAEDLQFRIPLKEQCDLKGLFNNLVDEIKRKNYLNVYRQMYVESFRRNQRKIQEDSILLTSGAYHGGDITGSSAKQHTSVTTSEGTVQVVKFYVERVKSNLCLFYFDLFLCILKGAVAVDCGVNFIANDLADVHRESFGKLLEVVARGKSAAGRSEAEQSAAGKGPSGESAAREDPSGEVPFGVGDRKQLPRGHFAGHVKELILNSLHYLIELLEQMKEHNGANYTQYKDTISRCVLSLEAKRVITYKEATTYIECKNFDKLSIFSKELNKLVTKVKTKNMYSIWVYNLLRENVSGYSKIIFLLESFFSSPGGGGDSPSGDSSTHKQTDKLRKKKKIISELFLKYKLGSRKMVGTPKGEGRGRSGQRSGLDLKGKSPHCAAPSEGHSPGDDSPSTLCTPEGEEPPARGELEVRADQADRADPAELPPGELPPACPKPKDPPQRKRTSAESTKRSWERHLNCFYCTDLIKLKNKIFTIAGLHNLCPRRVLSILIFFYEQNVESPKQLLPLFFLYTKETITDVILLELKIKNNYIREMEQKELQKLKLLHRSEEDTGRSNQDSSRFLDPFFLNKKSFFTPNYFKMCSILILNDLLNFNSFYEHILPNDELLKIAYEELYRKLREDYEKSTSERLTPFFLPYLPMDISELHLLYNKVRRYNQKSKALDRSSSRHGIDHSYSSGSGHNNQPSVGSTQKGSSYSNENIGEGVTSPGGSNGRSSSITDGTTPRGGRAPKGAISSNAINTVTTSEASLSDPSKIFEEGQSEHVDNRVVHYLLNCKHVDLKKKNEQIADLQNKDPIEFFLFDMIHNKSNGAENFVKNYIEREIQLRNEVANSKFLKHTNSYDYLFLPDDNYFFLLGRLFFIKNPKFLFLSSLINLNAWSYVVTLLDHMASYQCNPFLNYYVSLSMSRLIGHSITSFERAYLAGEAPREAHTASGSNLKQRQVPYYIRKANNVAGGEAAFSREDKPQNEGTTAQNGDTGGPCFFCKIHLDTRRLYSYQCIKVLNRNKTHLQNLFRDEKKIQKKKKKMKQILKSVMHNGRGGAPGGARNANSDRTPCDGATCDGHSLYGKADETAKKKKTRANQSSRSSTLLRPLRKHLLLCSNAPPSEDSSEADPVSSVHHASKADPPSDANQVSGAHPTSEANQVGSAAIADAACASDLDTFLNFFSSNRTNNYMKKIKSADDFFNRALQYVKYLGYFGYLYKSLVRRLLLLVRAYVKRKVSRGEELHANFDKLFIRFFFLCPINEDDEGGSGGSVGSSGTVGSGSGTIGGSDANDGDASPLNEDIWNVLRLVPVSRRYKLYSKFYAKVAKYQKAVSKLAVERPGKGGPSEGGGNTTVTPLLPHTKAAIALSSINFELAKNKLRKIIKRITSDILKDRYSSKVQSILMQLTRVINRNPFISSEVILQQCELFDNNMIVTLSESIKDIHSFSSDIFVFKIVERQQLLNVSNYQLSKQYSMNSSDLFDDSFFKPKKLINLSLVSAKFLSKHPFADLYPLIISIVKRLFSELHTSDQLFLRNRIEAQQRNSKGGVSSGGEAQLKGEPNEGVEASHWETAPQRETPPHCGDEFLVSVLNATNAKYPDVMSGYIFDVDYLQKLIEIYGGTSASIDVQELNEDQLNAQCGLKLLKKEIMFLEESFNFNMNNVEYEHIEKAEMDDERLQKLCVDNATRNLSNPNVVYLFLCILSKLKYEYLFDSNTSNLRNISSLIDKVDAVLLQFINFLQTNTEPYLYLTYIPSITLIFSYFDISQSFHIIRFAFPFFDERGGARRQPRSASPLPRGRGEAANRSEAANRDDPANRSDAANRGDAAIQRANEEKWKEAVMPIVQRYLSIESLNGINIDFYLTYWRLSITDIYVPHKQYQKVIERYDAYIKKLEKHHEENKKNEDYKWVLKKLRKLRSKRGTINSEYQFHIQHTEKIKKHLSHVVDHWVNPQEIDLTTFTAFVKCLIAPRILNSEKDSLFCSKFILLLLEFRTPLFNFCLLTYVCIKMLMPIINACTEKEALNIGLFFNELFSYAYQLCQDPKHFKLVSEENPCFSSTLNFQSKVTIEHSFIIGKVAKWEKLLVSLLFENNNHQKSWINSKSVVIFLFRVLHSFPYSNKVKHSIRKYLQNLHSFAQSRGWKDIAISVNSLKTIMERNRKAAEKEKKEEPEAKPQEGKAGSSKASAPAPNPDGNVTMNPFNTSNPVHMNSSPTFVPITKNLYNSNMYPVLHNSMSMPPNPYMKDNPFSNKIPPPQDPNNIMSLSSINPNTISINNDMNKRRDIFGGMQGNANPYPSPPPNALVHMNDKNMRMDSRAMQNEGMNYTLPQNFMGMHPYIPPPMHDMPPNQIFPNVHHGHMKTNRNSNSFSRR
ncbi:THO complex subunit 2, putative [Plasmodium vivax]|nr:THO complex subunit 2, putative [Plasmodium vivax]